MVEADSAPPEQLQQQQPVADETLNHQIKAIFDSCENAVFGVNALGHIDYWNQRCEQLFNFPQNISIKSQHSSDLLCGGDSRCSENSCPACAVNRNIQNEEQINNFQLTILQADGNSILVNIGTCYFYQQEQSETSTYFSLTPIS